MNFWKTLKKPIFGLSPMDGVTDVAFRSVVDEVGEPSVLFTEFVPVEAINANAERVLDAFITHETKTPTVAQLYGTDLKAYYLSTLVVCELGFDGVDINMGCPAKSVQSRGAGAGLIKTPELATNIIGVVRRATDDFLNGAYKKDSIPNAIYNRVAALKRNNSNKKSPIPVSLKTRTGYEKEDVESWIGTLALSKPDAITVHGRTFRQMYRGMADWQAIKKACDVVKKVSGDIVFLGNGDVKSIDTARALVQEMGIDGVLVGRGALGNPWIFNKNHGEVSVDEKFQTMIRHSQKFVEYFPHGHFVSLRKHMLWYASGFEGARSMHPELQNIKNISDLQKALKKHT